MKWRLSVMFFLFACCFVYAAYACSGKGPADPFTGMISYPPGKGGTDGNYWKGWNGNNMNLIIVPPGTTLGFEGVIQGGNSSLPDWEEGNANNIKGTTVLTAPKPTWTITQSNGNNDWRGGAPQGALGFSFKMFEKGPDCMIVDDTPACKAIWKLDYDQTGTAINLIGGYLALHPEEAALVTGNIPGLTADNMGQIRGNALYITHGVENYRAYKIPYTRRTDNVAPPDLKSGLRNAIPHSKGETQLVNVLDRSYYWVERVATVIQDPATTTPSLITVYNNVNHTITRTVGEKKVMVAECGYIAMQEWYPTGNYTTQFFVYPPSAASPYTAGPQIISDDFLAPQMTYKFNTPCFPGYWTIDLQSGLDSQKDCVWAWVETCQYSLADGSRVSGPNPSDNELYLAQSADPDDVAIGGVLVTGNYSSAGSTAGRNTVTYVSVLDKRRPASFEWNNSGGGTAYKLKGKTGSLLKDVPQPTVTNGKLSFTVYDDNPMIGAAEINTIEESLGFSLADLRFVDAGGGPNGASVNLLNDSNDLSRNLARTANGFTGVLSAKLYYNVCVPAYVGLKCNDEAADPFPSINGRWAVPAQRFIWKEIPSSQVTIKTPKMYKFPNANSPANKTLPVANDLGELINGEEWLGASSYEVEVPLTAFVEPMPFNFANNAVPYVLPFGTAGQGNFQAPTSPFDGTPILGGNLAFYGWKSTALKIFPVADDGLQQTPTATEVQKIIDTKFSGLEISNDGSVSYWDDPAGNTDLNRTISGATPVTGQWSTSVTSPNWGPFANVDDILDTGVPNIALKILNTKPNKFVMYGNLKAGSGQSDKFWEALGAAKDGSNCVSVNTNIGNLSYSGTDDQKSDDNWVFNAKLDEAAPVTFFQDFERSVDAKVFRPWLFALSSANLTSRIFDGTALSAANYWNGAETYNNDRVAYYIDSKVRLVFSYYTWDNINSMNLDSNCGMEIQGTKPNVAGRNTSIISLYDQAVFLSGDGKVADGKFWPDYIFNNPNVMDGGKECYIQLEAKDKAATALSRIMKVYFRVLGTGQEVIRTLEDRRQRVQ